MVFLIESNCDINLATLGEVVCRALEDLNKDRGTDYKAQPHTPDQVCGVSKEFLAWKIGRLEWDFHENSRVFENEPSHETDCLLVQKLKPGRGVEESLQLWLDMKNINPNWMLFIGWGFKRGNFYMDPSDERRFDGYLIGRAIKTEVPDVKKSMVLLVKRY